MQVKKVVKKSFVQSTDQLFIQFFRYIFVGGLSYMVDWGIMIVLIKFFIFYYLWAASISFLVGLFVNYLLGRLWIFRTSRFEKQSFEFFLTVVIGIVGLGLNGLFIWGLREFFNISPIWGKPIAAVPVFLWNFLARKYFVFSLKK